MKNHKVNKRSAKVKQKSKKHLEIKQLLPHTPQFFATVKEIFTFLHNSSNAVLDVLDNLIFLADRYVDVSPTQTTLGIKAGVCRQYTNEKIRDLQNAEVIVTRRIQGYNKPLRYFLNPIFFRTDVRIKLRDLLPALRYRSLTALFLHDPTLSKKSDINNIYKVRKSEFYITLEKIISSFYPSKLKKYYENMLYKSRKYFVKRVMPFLTEKLRPIPQLRTCTPVVRPKQEENLKRGNIMTVMTPVSMKDQELFSKCKDYRKTCIKIQNNKTEEIISTPQRNKTLNKSIGIGKFMNLFKKNRLKGSSE